MTERPSIHRYRLQRWSRDGALMLGLLGIAQLIAWGNRWYVTEMFARSARADDGVSWEFVYGRLHAAHDALVLGLVLLLLAGALTGVAVRSRRVPQG